MLAFDNSIASSTDGTTWSTAGFSGYPSWGNPNEGDLFYANGVYLAASEFNATPVIVYSGDGFNWSNATVPSLGASYYSTKFSYDGTYYYLGLIGTSLNNVSYLRSLDGITWTTVQLNYSGIDGNGNGAAYVYKESSNTPLANIVNFTGSVYAAQSTVATSARFNIL